MMPRNFPAFIKIIHLGVAPSAPSRSCEHWRHLKFSANCPNHLLKVARMYTSTEFRTRFRWGWVERHGKARLSYPNSFDVSWSFFRSGHVQEHRVSPDRLDVVSKLHIPERRMSTFPLQIGLWNQTALVPKHLFIVDEDLYRMHFGRSGGRDGMKSFQWYSILLPYRLIFPWFGYHFNTHVFLRWETKPHRTQWHQWHRTETQVLHDTLLLRQREQIGSHDLPAHGNGSKGWSSTW